MKRLFVLILALSLINCSNEPKDISGTYVGVVDFEEQGESAKISFEFILTHIGNNEYKVLSSTHTVNNGTGEIKDSDPKDGLLIYYPETGYLKHPIGTMTMQISDDHGYLFFSKGTKISSQKYYKDLKFYKE